MTRYWVRCLGCLALSLAVVGMATAQKAKVDGLLKDLKDKDPKVRVSAVDGLSKIADVRLASVKPALPNLLMALKDPDAGVRRAVIGVLGKLEIDPKEEVPVLIDLVKGEKDGGVLTAAVQALGVIGPPAKDVLPLLGEVFKNPDVNARRAALTTLGQIGADVDERLPILIEAVGAEKDPQLSAQTMQVLAQLGPKAAPALPTLLKRAKDANADVRRTVVAAVNQIQTDAGDKTRFFMEVLKTEKDRGALITAIQGLGQQGPAAKSAAAALMELQKTAAENDKELADQCAQALQRIQPKQ